MDEVVGNDSVGDRSSECGSDFGQVRRKVDFRKSWISSLLLSVLYTMSVRTLARLRPALRRPVALRPPVGIRFASSIKPFVRSSTLAAHSGSRPRQTHEIASLGPSLENKPVELAGWLHSSRRASEKLHFFSLRSAGSMVQLIVRDPALAAEMMKWPVESVVQVSGIVRSRKSPAKDASSPVDQVEVEVERGILLNPADALPFYPNRPPLANDDLRATHRYLDLRRDELTRNLRTRSEVAHIVRNYLHDNGFVEVETPILLNSSPEGAREFLVPTRVSSGDQPAFYALPQSPQQPKQLLVAGGAVPRYYQLARCFRDEDGRKDRQPEFTQIDLEMAFVDGAAPEATSVPAQGSAPWLIGGAQVRDIVEGLVKKIWKDIKGVDLAQPFKVMPYDVAMDVYGSDKPDTRFEMYTLPIGYYPTLTDESLDKVLMDQNASTVEWMVTPASIAQGIDVNALAGSSQFVRSTHM